MRFARGDIALGGCFSSIVYITSVEPYGLPVVFYAELANSDMPDFIKSYFIDEYKKIGGFRKLEGLPSKEFLKLFGYYINEKLWESIQNNGFIK